MVGAQDNIMKGHALSSVFGAKTPNSEWEYMTGNSMAFLPSGSVVYQQYISEMCIRDSTCSMPRWFTV